MIEYRTFKMGCVHKEIIEHPVFLKSYDVIIAGGGTAGSIAALKLAKADHNIVVLEQLHALGGVHSHMMFDYYMGNSGGFYEGLDAKIKKLETECAIVDCYGTHPFIRQYLYEEELQASGGKIEYGAVIIGVFVKDTKVIGVRYLQNEIIYDISGQFVIDATATAWIARMVGAKASIGRESDQRCQPFSNVRIYFNKETQRIEINNIDAGYMKHDNIQAYSNSVMNSAHNAIYDVAQTLQKEITLAMSPLLGIRESYTISAEKQIIMKDVLSCTSTNEPLFYSYANIDNHAKDLAFESQAICDWMVGLSLWGAKVKIGVSKETLLPKKTQNLVMAGRHIGVDHDIASQMRMMRDCQKCGEAAAILVHTAFKHNVALREVEYVWMKKQLLHEGCLHEQDITGVFDNLPLDEEPCEPLPKGMGKMKQALSSNRPGFAMLLAWQEKAVDKLHIWVHEHNQNLCINSAIVLGLLDDETGVEYLLEAIQKRDVYTPKTSKSYNVLRSISAIYILGRLGTRRAVDVLLETLKYADKLRNDKIIFDKLISSIDDYHFQYVTHCIRALYDIADCHPDLQGKINKSISQIMDDKSFQVFITLKANPNDVYNMSEDVKRYSKKRKNAQKKGR